MNIGVKIVLGHSNAFRWTALLDGRIMRFVPGVQASRLSAPKIFAPEDRVKFRSITGWMRGCGLGPVIFAALAAVIAFSPQRAIAQEVPLTRIAQIYGISADPFGEEILYLASERGFFSVGPDGLAQRLSPGTNKFTGFAADPSRSGRFIAAGDAT
ncbi:MAG: hypothetical protein HOE26_02300, partial [Rhodospirillaceae bacterium]|nr:hypothetical protein [Rhodospirillaceae bacterium]